MMQAGILTRHPKGTSAYYEIADPLVFEFCELACGQIGDRLRQHAETFLQAASLQSNVSTSKKNTRSQKTRTKEQVSNSRR